MPNQPIATSRPSVHSNLQILHPQSNRRTPSSLNLHQSSHYEPRPSYAIGTPNGFATAYNTNNAFSNMNYTRNCEMRINHHEAALRDHEIVTSSRVSPFDAHLDRIAEVMTSVQQSILHSVDEKLNNHLIAMDDRLNRFTKDLEIGTSGLETRLEDELTKLLANSAKQTEMDREKLLALLPSVAEGQSRRTADKLDSLIGSLEGIKTSISSLGSRMLALESDFSKSTTPSSNPFPTNPVNDIAKLHDSLRTELRKESSRIEDSLVTLTKSLDAVRDEVLSSQEHIDTRWEQAEAILMQLHNVLSTRRLPCDSLSYDGNLDAEDENNITRTTLSWVDRMGLIEQEIQKAVRLFRRLVMLRESVFTLIDLYADKFLKAPTRPQILCRRT